MCSLSLRTVPRRLLCMVLVYVLVLTLFLAVARPMRVDAALPLIVAGITIAPEAIAFIGAALIAMGFTFANHDQLVELIKHIANVDKPLILQMLEDFAKATAKKVGDKIVDVVEMSVGAVKSLFDKVKNIFAPAYVAAEPDVGGGELPTEDGEDGPISGGGTIPQTKTGNVASANVSMPAVSVSNPTKVYYYDGYPVFDMDSIAKTMSATINSNTYDVYKSFSGSSGNGGGEAVAYSDMVKQISIWHGYFEKLQDYSVGKTLDSGINNVGVRTEYLISAGTEECPNTFYRSCSVINGADGSFINTDVLNANTNGNKILTNYPYLVDYFHTYVLYKNSIYIGIVSYYHYVGSLSKSNLTPYWFRVHFHVKALFNTGVAVGDLYTPDYDVAIGGDIDIFTDNADYSKSIGAIGGAIGVDTPLTDGDTIGIVVPADVPIGKTLTDVVVNTGAKADVGTGTETGTETDIDTDIDTDVDTSKLKLSVIDVFPFCIPFDLIRAVKSLAVEPKAPVFSMDFSGTMFGEYKWELDLSDYESIAQIVRWIVWISFFVGLMFATRKLMKW